MYYERSTKTDPSPFTSTARDETVAGDGAPVHGPYEHYDQEFPSYQARYSIVSPDSGDRTTWNPFSHYKRERSYNLASQALTKTEIFTSTYPPYPAWRGVLNAPAGFLWTQSVACQQAESLSPPAAMYGITSDQELYIAPPSDLDALIGRGLSATLPSIRAQLSSLNSLYEIGDLLSIRNTASHLADTLKHLLRTLLSSGKVPLGISAREVARRAADSHLQYAFNVRPLWSDIQGVLKALKEYRKKVNHLLSQSAKNQVRYYSVTLSEPAFATDFDTNPTPAVRIIGNKWGFNSVAGHRRVRSYSSKFTFEVQYSFRYTDFQRQHAALFAILDSLGVNLNPAIVWNALRWTFVIDWFIGISRFLDQFKVENLKPVINIQRALWSIKRERLTSYSLDDEYQKGLPATSVKESAYRRQPFQLTTNSIQSSGLSLNEFSLGVSLFITNRKRH